MLCRSLVAFAFLLTFTSGPALAETFEAPDNQKVFVLKHPDKAKGIAFVKTTDTERLKRLIDLEGFELVARTTPEGVVPVTGDVVPDELAEQEGVALSGAINFGEHGGESSVTSAVSRSPERDPVDIGLGLALGLTTGGKIRVLGTFDSGFVAGVDLDAGTVIFVSDATASAIVGWSFNPGGHIIRPYLTVGGGSGVIFALIAIAEATVLRGGAGLEWKPARWFGLGLEGGLETFFYKEGQKTGEVIGAIPFGRLTVMFYFW